MAGQPTPPPLFTQRTALILVAGLLAGLIFGACGALSMSPATAVMSGLAAFGATVAGLHQLLE